MDATRATDFIREQIKLADFDRERVRVRAVESADGTKVEVYADTIDPIPGTILRRTNYNPIDIGDIGDEGYREQLRMIISSMAKEVLEEGQEQHGG